MLHRIRCQGRSNMQGYNRQNKVNFNFSQRQGPVTSVLNTLTKCFNSQQSFR